MNSTELIAKVRLNTTTQDSDPDYTDAVVLSELNDAFTTKFQLAVVDADSGYWVQQAVYTVTAGLPNYRLPPRACGISKVDIGSGPSSAPSYVRLAPIDEGKAELFETPVTQLGQPFHWVARGDQVVLLPTPDNSGYTLRITFYIRPSKLYASQNSVSGTDRGRITNINAGARQVTVNNLPFDQSLAVPAAITSGLQLIDIVHPNGWHELAMYDVAQTYSGLVITLGGTADMSSVQVGDYVRVADQTDWPAIPVDFHRCLADIASAKILIQQDYQPKAQGYFADVSSDMERFSRLIARRQSEDFFRHRADLPSLRRRYFW